MNLIDVDVCEVVSVKGLPGGKVRVRLTRKNAGKPISYELDASVSPRFYVGARFSLRLGEEIKAEPPPAAPATP